MSPGPIGAAGAWTAILDAVACAFTRPGFAIFADLAEGWVLTPGRRTVTRIISVIDADGRRAHDAYHRLIRDGAWQMSQLWRVMAVAVTDCSRTPRGKTGRSDEHGTRVQRDPRLPIPSTCAWRMCMLVRYTDYPYSQHEGCRRVSDADRRGR